MLDIEYIKSLLYYDAASGDLIWKVRAGLRIMPERKAGYISKDKGYVRLKICKKNYMAHRVAWAIYYGVCPEFEIDHINRIRHDNRISNLRDVTHSINMANRTDYKSLSDAP